MHHHTHIITYYLYLADLAGRGAAWGIFTEGYFIGRAFLYADFEET